MPDCKSCHHISPDFKDLAGHIIKLRRTHPRWQIVWAQKFLANANYLNQKVSRQNLDGRVPLNEQDRQNKEDSQRELSGEIKTALCQCPSCKTAARQALPIEYISNPLAWRNKSGVLMVDCVMCRK